MAETSGFFEARLNEETEEYDRLYYAEQFANYFKLFIGNGVFIQNSNQLQVESVAGMNIKVNSGWGFINGYWYNNSEELNITIPVNTFTVDRYDLVVLRKDLALREISIVYLENETNIRRDGNYYDLALAKIKVPVGSASISNSNITDKRPDKEVCGFVKGLVDIITTDALFNQFTAQFNEWFTDIKEKLEEDPAGKLQAQIGNLGDLVTVNKDNLVKSINEVVDKLDNLSAEDVGAVAGVKGNNETAYRTGQVNLTPANIGAVAVGSSTMAYGLDPNSISTTLTKLGFSLDNTFEELYQILKNNYNKFENYFLLVTTSNSSIFNNSLPVRTGGLIECIGLRGMPARCTFKFYNFRMNDEYINTALDGTLNGWIKIPRSNEHNVRTYTSFEQLGTTLADCKSLIGLVPQSAEFTITINSGEMQTAFNNGLIPIQKTGVLHVVNANKRGYARFTTDNQEMYLGVATNANTDQVFRWTKVATETDFNNYNLKTYTDLSQIGITKGSETISDIAENLPEKSMLVMDVTGNHAAIYPETYGILKVEKLNAARISFKFQASGKSKTWVGGWSTGVWSGWEKVLTDNGIEFQIVDGELQYRYDTEVWG